MIYCCHLSYPLFHSHTSHHESLTWTKAIASTRAFICVHLLSVLHVATRVISFKCHLMKLVLCWKFIKVPLTKIQGLMTWSLPAFLAWSLSITTPHSLSSPNSQTSSCHTFFLRPRKLFPYIMPLPLHPRSSSGLNCNVTSFDRPAGPSNIIYSCNLYLLLIALIRIVILGLFSTFPL